jgi:hypothetical protein
MQPPTRLVSFPKSGRTWLRVMLDKLALPVNATHDTSAHREARHFLNMRPCGPEILNAPAIIFLHRDPRDTAVSGYFQVAKRLNGYPGSIAEFIRDPRHGIEKIVRFNLSWMNLQLPANRLLRVGYEELQADCVAQMRTIAEFMSEPRSTEAIKAAVDECSFENMQRQEREGSLGKDWGEALTPKNPDDVDTFKVRRGKIAGYVDYFDAADIAYCDEILARYAYPASHPKVARE